MSNCVSKDFKCFYNMGFSEKNYQKEIGNMERWKEVFAGIIPKAVYQMQLINGEKQGLTNKCNDFQNIIYEVQGGEFAEQINKISDGYGEVLKLRHYVVITQNYNVDIVTEWEPKIEVLEM